MIKTPGRNGGKGTDRQNNLIWTIPIRNLSSKLLRCKAVYGKIRVHVRIPHSLHVAARKRQGANLTQIDLAKLLKETQSYVSKVERGDRRLDLVQLKQFCKAINVPFVQFVQEFDRLTSRPKR